MALRQMFITLEEKLVDDLCVHYRRSGFRAVHVGDGTVEVARDDAPNPEQEEREIRLHLRIWQAMNPAVNPIVRR